MTNSIVDNAASQQMSVALNQGAVNFSTKIAQTDDREVDQSLSAREIETSKLIEKGQTGKLAVEVLKPFFSKLAQVGITLNPQAKFDQENEGRLRDFMEREGLSSDSVEIRSETPVVAALKHLKQQSDDQTRKGSAGASTSDEVLSLLKEYTAVLSDYLSSQSPVTFSKLKDLKEKLKNAGISEEKLARLEAEVKSGKKIDVSEILKEGMLLEVMATGIIEKAVRKRGLKEIVRGLEKFDLPAISDKAKVQAKAELHGFILESLENELIKKTHLQDTDFSEAFKLIDLAKKTGLDYEKWLCEYWPKKKDDHGLFLMDVPHAATGMNVNTSTDNPNQNNSSKHGFEYEQKDENEILLNRLRAQYMQRALKGDAVTHLKTEFKIRKLKNGLFKLGVFTKDMDEQVMHEAEVVAKIKIIEMLKEALIERGTFYELAGPAHELVERKLKGLLKNAQRLGMPISTEEFTSLRDNANRRVFELSKRELDEVVTSKAVKDSPFLAQKEMHLLKLLARLQAESKIEESCKISVS